MINYSSQDKLKARKLLSEIRTFEYEYMSDSNKERRIELRKIIYEKQDEIKALLGSMWKNNIL